MHFGITSNSCFWWLSNRLFTKLLFALFPSGILSSSLFFSFESIITPVAMLTMSSFFVELNKFTRSLRYWYMSVTWIQSSAIALAEYSWCKEYSFSPDKLQRSERNLKYCIFSCLIIFHLAATSFSLLNPIMPPFPFAFLLHSFPSAWSTGIALHFRLLSLTVKSPFINPSNKSGNFSSRRMQSL